MKPFTAGIGQFDIKKGDIGANLTTAEGVLLSMAEKGVEFALLPEMWTCGFDMENLAVHAEKTPEIVAGLGHTARRYKMAIAGSMPEIFRGGIYNTLYIVDRDGKPAGSYRKIHLFSPTGEDRYFSRGDVSRVVQTSLGPMGLMICYDLRFPELCLSLALKGAVLVLISAQWPKARIMHWDILLRARAVENQLFILAANRCGEEDGLIFGGHSRIITPQGEIAAMAGEEAESITANIDFDIMTEFRNRIPCLKERVPEAYEYEI